MYLTEMSEELEKSQTVPILKKERPSNTEQSVAAGGSYLLRDIEVSGNNVVEMAKSFASPDGALLYLGIHHALRNQPKEAKKNHQEIIKEIQTATDTVSAKGLAKMKEMLVRKGILPQNATEHDVQVFTDWYETLERAPEVDYTTLQETNQRISAAYESLAKWLRADQAESPQLNQAINTEIFALFRDLTSASGSEGIKLFDKITQICRESETSKSEQYQGKIGKMLTAVTDAPLLRFRLRDIKNKVTATQK